MIKMGKGNFPEMKKNAFIFALFLFLGLLTGSIVAKLLEPVDALAFLTKSTAVLWEPKADFDFIKYNFSIQVKLNLLNIAGLVTAIWIYRKL